MKVLVKEDIDYPERACYITYLSSAAIIILVNIFD